MFTGHHLLRRPSDLDQRTWKDADSAVSWLTGIYRKHPPAHRTDGRAADCGLTARATYARPALDHGTDVVWCYYLPGTQLINYAVICCPNLPLHPTIPCPLG
ncbi:hypothetical protein [Kitasatospora sp. NPDC101183]|uniref:hypothetical protein n=1 Tax=Kitasatospora sp. NPDC101183 TaxID=3364100 RepID=UPI00380383B4